MTQTIAHNLLPNEVICLEPEQYIDHTTCQAHEVMEMMRSQAAYELLTLLSEEGLECQALRLGEKDWQAGRLRLVLQFEPDQPLSETVTEASTTDSPLDEIRRLAGE